MPARTLPCVRTGGPTPEQNRLRHPADPQNRPASSASLRSVARNTRTAQWHWLGCAAASPWRYEPNRNSTCTIHRPPYSESFPERSRPRYRARSVLARSTESSGRASRPLLDLFDAVAASTADCASFLGCSSNQLTKLFASESHLWAAANEIRQRHGLSPLRQ